MTFHAVVIGSGADALVAAHILARAGRNVLVLEQHAVPTHDIGWVPQELIRNLRLDLEVERPDPWASIILPDGGTLKLWRDVARTVESIRKLSAKDAEKWPEFCRRMSALAKLFEQLYTQPPADPLNLMLALRVRGLGRQGMEDLMRVLPMSVAELLDDWFECEPLKGALGAMGVLHLKQGPRSGGTAFRLVHHHVGCAEGVFRPQRSNLGAALRTGVQLRAARIGKIIIKGGEVTAVALADGEELSTQLVVSSIDPRRTMLELADPAWLDPELARALRSLRRGGVAARVSFEGGSTANLVWAPSLDYLERAYDHVKYGRISPEPYLEAYGREVHFQYVPDETAATEGLADTARRLLPGFESAKAIVLGPAELERDEGWAGGQAYHAELALDQALWMRPLPELAQYRTPIEGLWLCGPGTHPGGGIAGASGYNCAREILKEKRRQ
ncbi:MAG TPA: NAD(P)/FAD-dependent oxidoreductase [Burkholderiales bacterium]|nr:NAD(P)/FAD-dependent oxidoreductase [Burkholderiales bacterium]